MAISGSRAKSVKSCAIGVFMGVPAPVIGAALFSRCDSPLRAVYTASKINKRAGEILFKKYKFNFSSEDLAEGLALAAAEMC